MALPFLKMHGLGNDFLVIDDLGKPQALQSPMTPALAQRMCDRRFGVGADQILWLRTPQAPGAADARMEILNADGSTAEMCGNGIRAVALYLRKHGPKPGQSEYRVETLAGLMHLAIRGDQVRVNLGPPVLGAGFGKDSQGERIEVGDVGPLPRELQGRSLRFFEVSMGNPHAVIFVDDARAVPLETLGRAIEIHPRFPKRTNVEFVQVLGPREIIARIWERGAGATLACGTGACASAVAALALRKVQGEVAVSLPGGMLKIAWDGPGQAVYMEGPATEVFRGEYYL